MVYLPDTYYVNDSKRHIDPHLFSREELGLPKQGFVFCCFNQSYKLSPLMFDVWMQLLQQVPHSVLWLLTCHATAQENLYREAQKRGIAPQRLIFAPKISSSMHLARLKQADLFWIPCRLTRIPPLVMPYGRVCLWLPVQEKPLLVALQRVF